MAMYWGPIASNEDTIRELYAVHVRSLGCFEQTGGSETHGEVSLGVLSTTYSVCSCCVGFKGLEMAI